MRIVQFKSAAVSSTANAFGLRGIILVAKSGRAFEVAGNHLSVTHIRENPVISLPVGRRGKIKGTPSFSFELPRPLPRAPRAVVREVWA